MNGPLYGLTPEQMFDWAGPLVLPGWILLVLAPRWIVTRCLVHYGLIPAIFGILYLAILVPLVMQGGLKLSDFGSLEGVAKLFANPWAVVVGWYHYCAFDLWTGAWEVRDAGRIRLSHLWVIPCLALTFLFGPVGLLTYLAVRWVNSRRFEVE